MLSLRRPGLALGLLAVVLCHSLSGAEDRVLFDFEAGTFDGWTVDGIAPFGAQPVRPDTDMQAQHAPTARYRFRGWVGDWMVSQDIRLSQRRGIRETEVPRGRLISPPFVIDRDHLRFRFGGLLHPSVYVALVMEDSPRPEREGETFQLARQSYANNKFDLVERGWDVRDLRGRQARIHLVANAAHRVLFRADHFVLSDTPTPVDVLYARTHWLDSTAMAPGKFHLMFAALNEGPAFTHASVVRGHDGRWHVFAEESKNDNGYFGFMNNLLYHASADDLRGRWGPLEPVLVREPARGEAWIRCPVVTYDDQARRYVALYWGTGAAPDRGPFGVCAATSPDGVNWTRVEGGPVFTHDFSPLLGSVVREDGRWVLYYSNHADERVHVDRAVLYRRTSADLVSWSAPAEVAVTSSRGQSLGYTRPVVFKRGDTWYLLTNNRVSQQGRTRFLFTQVYASRNPTSWNVEEGYRGNLNTFFGPQVFPDETGAWQMMYWHVTSGGPWIARVRFDETPLAGVFPTEWPGIPVAP